ncbi:MAG: hypothetical protein ACFB0G_18450 [Leptolyngbyaceae cyanobacterium]
MKSSSKVALITVGSAVSLSALGASAQAQATGTAADLLPLDSPDISAESLPDQTKALPVAGVSASVQPEATYSPDLLRTVASNINDGDRDEDKDDTPDIGDLVDLSFFEQFIDDNGNVDLPLGITFYEAMGRTSIGFGGDFR